MILHTNLWLGHNGASHRKNLDTPPLTGLRLEPKRFHSEPQSNDGACVHSTMYAVPKGTAPKIRR
jgi:hypothetical protein